MSEAVYLTTAECEGDDDAVGAQWDREEARTTPIPVRDDVGAVAGAEVTFEEVSSSTTRKDDEVDSSLSEAAEEEVATFSCEECNCEWLCSHHEHQIRDKGFICDARTFEHHAARGCPGCRLWTDIASNRCSCTIADDRWKQSHEIHPLECVETAFDDRRLPVVRMTWCCAIRTTRDIELATIEDLDKSMSKFAGHVHEDRLSDDCTSLLRDWVENCDKAHALCEPSERPAPPQRLLDVRTGELSLVKLCRMGREPVRYLALSYCWGGSKPPQTIMSNKAAHEGGIPLSTLPRSYVDAVKLAQKLDIDFVWIDSYCIVQDDPLERDFEIARMGEIFQNAYLVVIAASAASPYAGFLANKRLAAAPSQRERFSWHESSVRYGKLDNIDNNKINFRNLVHLKGQGKDACGRMRIGARAWTYQERLLARRCLVFQEKEIIWECNTACLCECGGARLDLANYESQLLPCTKTPFPTRQAKASVGRLFLDSREAYRFWRKSILAFARRDLSYPEDRLRAISALASVVQAATGDQYLAGIWKRDIVRQLAWRNIPSYDEYAPYTTYIAPSWSWASTPVPTGYYHWPDKYSPSYPAIVLEAACVLSGPDALGAVCDGYLVLHAIHCDVIAEIWRSESDNSPTIRVTFADGTMKTVEDTRDDFAFLDGLRVNSVDMDIGLGQHSLVLQRYNVSTSSAQEDCSGRIHLVWLEEDVCLLLAFSQRVLGAYERIGILSSMSPAMPDEMPSTIKLV